MFDWLVQRKAWATIADTVAGALFSAGLLGEGAEGVARKGAIAKFLRGQREQILSPVLDAYAASLKTGVPMGKMLKDPNFWISMLVFLASILPQVQAMMPEGSGIWLALGGLLALVNFVRENMKLKAAEVEEVVSRNVLRARIVEADTLTKRLRAGSSGLDQEL